MTLILIEFFCRRVREDFNEYIGYAALFVARTPPYALRIRNTRCFLFYTGDSAFVIPLTVAVPQQPPAWRSAAACAIFLYSIAFADSDAVKSE
jgi:hypothetical protein